MSCSSVAVDTESNSLHAYREQVCLVQFSTGSEDYLVDPLALQDLSALAPVFSSPAIEKVFHAAEYDVICLKRDYRMEFQNIFDTMLAARILGIKAIGLGAMLNDTFGLELDKRFQKADWRKRPMSAAMLSYARMDTHYLLDLRKSLAEQLDSRNLMDLAAEDFKRIAKVNGTTQPDDCLDGFWRINGAQHLDGQQAAVLKELFAFREKEARRRDTPPFKVMANDFLLGLAQAMPRSEEELFGTGLNARLLQRYERGLMAAIKTGLDGHPLHRPHHTRQDPDLKARIDMLKGWRKETADKLEVESDVVLPRELLVKIAEVNPASIVELKGIMFCFPWRFANYGELIFNILKH